MKKIILLLLLAFGTSLTELCAQHVSELQALDKAKSFMKRAKFSTASQKSSLRRVRSSSEKESKEADTYYIFNVAANGGFVIVSADERTHEILGYATHGNVEADKMPDNMKVWLKTYEQQIRSLSDNMSLSSAELPSHPIVVPLLSTAWNQDAPYNLQCPEYDDKHCVTGCEATAMAQVMNYFQWPQTATTEIPAYSSYESLPATQFSWDKMKDFYLGKETGEENQAVAQLMRYCGQSVQMDYSLTSSSAVAEKIPSALKNYFGYDSTARLVARGSDDVEWDALIYGELQAGRPVIYGGFQSTDGGWIVDGYKNGHEFVCDGYDGAGNYHINWGWGGYCDGYYKLSALAPAGSGIGGGDAGVAYLYGQDAVVGIQPLGYVKPDESLSLNCQASITVTGRKVTELNQPVQLHIVNKGAAFRNQPVILYATEEGKAPAYVYGMRLSMAAGEELVKDFLLQFTEAGTVRLTLKHGDDLLAETNVDIAEAFKIEIKGVDSYFSRVFNCADNTLKVTVVNNDTRVYDKEIEVCIYPKHLGESEGRIFKSEVLNLQPGEEREVTIQCDDLDDAIIYNYVIMAYINPQLSETVHCADWKTGQDIKYPLHYLYTESINLRGGVGALVVTDSEKKKGMLRYSSYEDDYIVLKSTVVDNVTGIKYVAQRNDFDFPGFRGPKGFFVDEGFTTLSDGMFRLYSNESIGSVDWNGQIYDQGQQTMEEVYLPSSLRYVEEELFGGCPELKAIYMLGAEPPLIVGDGCISKDLMYTAEPELYDKVTLYVPAGSKEKYTAWSYFKHIEEFDASQLPKPLTVTLKNHEVFYGDMPDFSYVVEGGELHGSPEFKAILGHEWNTGNIYLTEENLKDMMADTELKVQAFRGTVTDKYVFMCDDVINVKPAPLYLTTGDLVMGPYDWQFNIPVQVSGFKFDDTYESIFGQYGYSHDAFPDFGELPPVISEYPVGKYPIVVQPISVNAAKNYEQISRGGTCYVENWTKLVASNLLMTYGDEVPALTYRQVGEMPLWGEPTLTTDVVKTTSPGKYPIVIGKGTLENHRVEFANGTLEVVKAPLTVKAPSITITEGDPIPEMILSYEGLRNNETEAQAFTTLPTISCTATASSPAGTYLIKVNSGVSANYAPTYQNGVLTIVHNWKPTTVKAVDKTMVYGDVLPELTYTSEGDFLGGIPAIKTTATKYSPVGMYDILVSQGTVQNPNVSYVNGTLTITKAPLTITAKSYTRKQGEENPVFELEYSGLKNNETADVALQTLPTITCIATTESVPGEYVIKLSGGTSQNYELALVDGKLTIVEPDGIYTLGVDVPEGHWYTLQGQRMQGRPAKKGVFILEGRKVLVK